MEDPVVWYLAYGLTTGRITAKSLTGANVQVALLQQELNSKVKLADIMRLAPMQHTSEVGFAVTNLVKEYQRLLGPDTSLKMDDLDKEALWYLHWYPELVTNG